MNNMLLSAAIGDIAGSIYERRNHSTKDYDRVQVFAPGVRFTDDTVCTFACAEALVCGLDMSQTLYRRCNQHPHAGYGGKFRQWLASPAPQPYGSFGNGSAMRCSAAGWLAKNEAECVEMATATALPTHNHPEGVKGAVATALAIFHLKNGRGKDYVRKNVLEHYYPDWATKNYAEIKPHYRFDSTCQGSVGPAILAFLDSEDYIDCLKQAIALGGDADTQAAIAGPMAYALYREMPTAIVEEALTMLPDWMQQVNTRFDRAVNR